MVARCTAGQRVGAFADMDVEGERVDMGVELEEEKRKDRNERPHPVCTAVKNGMPKARGGRRWAAGGGRRER